MNAVKIVKNDNDYQILDMNNTVIYEDGMLELCDDDTTNAVNTISVFAAKTLLALLQGEIKWVYGRAIYVTRFYDRRKSDGVWKDAEYELLSVSVNFRKFDKLDRVPEDNEHSKLYHERYHAYDNALHQYFKTTLKSRVGFNCPGQLKQSEVTISVPVIYDGYKYDVTIKRPCMYYAYNRRTWWEFDGNIELRREKIKEEA